MQGEVIKSFLVGLGFDIDESSLAAFNKGIQSAALRVTALYGAINAFAAGIVLAFSKISEGFEQMGYDFHIIAPAINKAILLRNELLRAYSAAGINIRKTIVESVQLNLSLTKTKYALEAIYKSVGSKFFAQFTKESDAFRKRLYQNMPAIIKGLETLVKWTFKAFDAVTQLGVRLWSILGRVYEFFVQLDKVTDGWSTKILAVIAAWRLLNLAFLATPLGIILTGLVALLALYDDFQTYKEGGKSFFNWGPIIPIIDKITDVLKTLWGVFQDVVHLVQDAFNGSSLQKWEDFKKLISDIVDLFNRINDSLDTLIRKLGGETLNKILDWRDSVDSAVFGSNGGNTFPGSPVAAQRGDFGGVGTLVGTPANTNINANMQTSVTITGSPNADATARAVGQQQTQVNRDMVRNLKRPTR